MNRRSRGRFVFAPCFLIAQKSHDMFRKFQRVVRQQDVASGTDVQSLGAVTVAPITSAIRDVPSEVVLTEEGGMKAPCAVNLHNAVTISQDRLGRRVAHLSSVRMNEVCAALRFTLGCDLGSF